MLTLESHQETTVLEQKQTYKFNSTLFIFCFALFKIEPGISTSMGSVLFAGLWMESLVSLQVSACSTTRVCDYAAVNNLFIIHLQLVVLPPNAHLCLMMF